MIGKYVKFDFIYKKAAPYYSNKDRNEQGYKEPASTSVEKTVLKSTTDPDYGYINQERKKGLGYLTEMSVDTESGSVLGVDCYSANRRESNMSLEHIERIKTDTELNIKKLA